MRRPRDALLARQVRRRLRPARPGDVRGPSGEEQPAALLARPGAEIGQVLRRADHQRVVLHHHHRVGPRRQLLEDRDQPLGVARVETRRGLVEHVERVRQVGAERVGQLDPLGLASRERSRQPVQREVAEVHAQQEAEPRLQLDQCRPGDGAVRLAEAESCEETGGRAHAERAHLGDVLLPERHAQRLGPEPGPAARGARPRHLITLHHEAVPGLVGLLL